jgi:steroid 5-alpha reductase family enzyme
VADQQQWNYQTKKYELLKTSKPQNLPQPYKRGFITEGLFSISRHPNFVCEISIWWVIYLFSVSSTGWNYSFVGAALLNLLFLGSTALTEKISIEKYPAYKDYQNQVSRLVPFMIIPKKSSDQKEKSN